MDLRYGHVMIMADQDHDGSHIKGLVINFIHKFYPSLLKLRGFMQSFVTPVIKVIVMAHKPSPVTWCLHMSLRLRELFVSVLEILDAHFVNCCGTLRQEKGERLWPSTQCLNTFSGKKQ